MKVTLLDHEIQSTGDQQQKTTANQYWRHKNSNR